jgi:hypothetical protein
MGSGKPSSTYLSRAQALASAIEIAAAVRAAAPVDGDAHMLEHEADLRDRALHPEPHFAKVASLKFLEQAFLTFWYESPDPRVRVFWSEVAKRGLPFRLRDVAREALARGRITSRLDHDAIIDLLTDEGLSTDERTKLDAMLGAYASRATARSRG